MPFGLRGVKMKIEVKCYKYAGAVKTYSHSYFREYELTAKHCPECGETGMFVGDGDDYYQGRQYMCVSCGGTAQLDLGGKLLKDDVDVFASLRDAVGVKLG
jgi:transposase